MKIGNNPVIFLTRKMWEYAKGNRKRIVFFFVLFTCANVVSLSEPVIVGKMLNLVQQGGLTTASLPRLAWYLSFFVTTMVLMWVFHGPARCLERLNAFFVRINYKRYLLEGTMSLPIAWHSDHHSGSSIDKIEKGTKALYEFASETFEVIGTIIRFVGAYLVLVYFNVHASYLVLLLLLVTVVIIIKFDKVLAEQYAQLNKYDNSVSAKVYDALSNITTVIILRVEKLISRSIVKKMFQPFKLFSRNTSLNEVKWFLVSVSTSITIFLVIFSYAFQQLRLGQVLLVGTVYLLYGYIQRITDLFYHFAYLYNRLVEHKAAVLNAEEIAKDFKKVVLTKEVSFPRQWNELVITNLNFSYHSDEGADTHLDNITLRLRKNEKVAFIGSSGSGKTTLLKVIRGLYEPRQLQVMLDGVQLPNGLKSISGSIALIPQDPEIFATTILENITIGIGYSLAHVKKFTDYACFTEVALRLPKQFHSSIVEKGVNLSGGERQRLALARGLLASEDKEIILLDEPTSSVDTKNERLIYENIFSQFKDKLIISSLHRLHLLPLFDTIYLFDRGQIRAVGSFDQLIKTSEHFKQLWDKYHESKMQ